MKIREVVLGVSVSDEPEVGVPSLSDAVDIIYTNFEDAEIEKIELSEKSEYYDYEITFSTAMELKQILEVLDKHEPIFRLVSLKVRT